MVLPTPSTFLMPWLCALTPSSVCSCPVPAPPSHISVVDDSQAAVTTQIICVNSLLLEVQSEDKPPKFGDLPYPHPVLSHHTTLACTHVFFVPLTLSFLRMANKNIRFLLKLPDFPVDLLFLPTSPMKQRCDIRYERKPRTGDTEIKKIPCPVVKAAREVSAECSRRFPVWQGGWGKE